MKQLYKVPKMMCMGCVGAINEALHEVPNIEKIMVDLPTKTVTVMFKGAINNAAVITAIKSAGYDATIG